MFKSFAAAIMLSIIATGAVAQENSGETEAMTSTGPIVQVALPTQDLEAAKTFYTEVLGLPLMFETDRMAFFSAGSVSLLIGPPTSPEAAKSGGVVYFQPDDIVKAAETLEARGVTFKGEPEVVERTQTGVLQLRFFRDPDGNQLALMGEVAR